ncbi:MAG: 4Fe-4S dicluster domain-containing protein [Desulfovibrio sp.]|nr:MAG: 4Fe-4S dicluster domain-containing protein [Desulfovibrio sp.]
MKRLAASKMERCIGCYSCSLACARLVHKRLSWSCSGIRIHTSGGMSSGFEAKVCVACDPAPCAEVCPTEALTQRRDGGVKVNRSMCIRCGKCAAACPVDAIYLGVENNKPYICIHCGRCVAFCPQGCLELVDMETSQPEPNASSETPKEADHA